MNTHGGMQLLLIVMLLGIGFAAVLGTLLPTMHRRLRSWSYVLLCYGLFRLLGMGRRIE